MYVKRMMNKPDSGVSPDQGKDMQSDAASPVPQEATEERDSDVTTRCHGRRRRYGATSRSEDGVSTSPASLWNKRATQRLLSR